LRGLRFKPDGGSPSHVLLLSLVPVCGLGTALDTTRVLGASPPTPAYSIQEIRPLNGGSITLASDVSDKGYVAGRGAVTVTSGGQQVERADALLFFKGKSYDLGVPKGALGAVGEAVNDEGCMTSEAEYGSQTLPYVVCRRKHGAVWRRLTDVGGYVSQIDPTDINDAYQISGGHSAPGGPAILWRRIGQSSYKAAVLPAIAGATSAYAFGLDSNGDAVGDEQAGGGARGTIWPSAGGVVPISRWGGSAGAIAVSARTGQARLVLVAGTRLVGGTAQTVLWRLHISGRDVRMTSTPKLIRSLFPDQDCAPVDINRQGAIVGRCSLQNSRNSTPFLWKGGMTYSLQDLVPAGSNWQLTDATAINDKGQIVGDGTHNGETRGFVLTPR
jgi:hypothetical protein